MEIANKNSIIDFCDVCNNMLYMQIDIFEEGKKQELNYICKNCNNKQKKNSDTGNCVFKKNYNTGRQKNYREILNKYTTLDPTLPRVTNIKCPNENCLSNKKKDPAQREVVYLKYDSKNMKFLYVCCVCETAWKNTGTGTDSDNIKWIERD